jgi:hypothetical protein
MGVSNSYIRLLMREGNRKKFTGKVLQLGKQLVIATEESIERLAEEEKFELSEPRCDPGYFDSPYPGVIGISDEYLFQRLGFDVVDSLDKSSFEGANVIHDMNCLLDRGFKNIGSYDLIIDGGTIEHIFHTPNALKNIFDLLVVDGRVIHLSPVNMINHGYYNFATFFFEEYYAANEFLINECGVIKIPDENNNDRWLYTSCDKSSQFMRSLNQTLFDGAVFGLNFIATKTNNSTGDKVPQQGVYVGTWDSSKASPEHGNSGLIHGDSPLKSLYRKILTVPVLKYLARYLRDKYAVSLVKWEVV